MNHFLDEVNQCAKHIYKCKSIEENKGNSEIKLKIPEIIFLPEIINLNKSYNDRLKLKQETKKVLKSKTRNFEIECYDKFLNDFDDFDKFSKIDTLKRSVILMKSSRSETNKTEIEMPYQVKLIQNEKEIELKVNNFLKTIKDRFKPNQIEETVIRIFTIKYFIYIRSVLI